MRNRVARAGERIVVVCGTGAFAALLFALKFAWSTTSLYVGVGASLGYLDDKDTDYGQHAKKARRYDANIQRGLSLIHI